ncbi:hypothetical protein [Stenotrophomonas sp. NA06056]|uniref:hypothetical protein n=1 Tax=Stenotrophomonas sp. NA06056 TaxID=2742129 RepID=UPI00158E178D|nr:hypothetical protein [Stenotrophomonas sp. NA06056]QKW56749.1 hypothetical protein HUT07_09005 [Stenotrophomonas sp. NA06056]
MSLDWLLIGALLAAPAVDAQDETWSVRLSGDLAAIDAALRDSHPGMFDARNPGFVPQLDAALAQARSRAAKVDSHAGYWWTLKGYAATFNDGHVSLNAMAGAPQLAIRWPGFLTGFDGDAQIVMTAEEGVALPPLGATLASCDGVDAQVLARQRVGDFSGRWNLQASRIHAGGEVLLDQGNPFIATPRMCTFLVQGRMVDYPLVWKPIDAAALAPRLADTRRSFRPANGMRRMPGGGYWITTSSFNADPTKSNFKELTRLLQTLAGQSDALRQAPVVVLDVRGNSGGASQWSLELARLVWGRERVDTIGDHTWVEWRASKANLAQLQAFQATLKASPDAAAEMLSMLDTVTAGMAQALAKGEPLWHAPRPPDAASPPAAVDTPARPRRNVVVVADASCGSACLDALDLWKQLGAIQVGVETSADTVYMDVRPEPLPSGLARISIPMKVFRGRARGFNEALLPDCRYAGDMRDGAALETWVLQVDAARQAGDRCP